MPDADADASARAAVRSNHPDYCAVLDLLPRLRPDGSPLIRPSIRADESKGGTAAHGGMGETGFYLNFLAYSTNPKHEAHLYASEAKLVRRASAAFRFVSDAHTGAIARESRSAHVRAPVLPPLAPRRGTALAPGRSLTTQVRAFVVDIFKLSEDKVPSRVVRAPSRSRRFSSRSSRSAPRCATTSRSSGPRRSTALRRRAPLVGARSPTRRKNAVTMPQSALQRR